MLRTQIYIPEEMIADLRNLAAVEDVSLSEIIRKKLRKALKISERKADLMKTFVGKVRAGTKTDATKEISSYYQRIR
jgi:hypothetical protein